MSLPPREDPAAQNIPPIEIGSIAALPSDGSEFIGSASGVFFADTVFRAFARATSATTAATNSSLEHHQEPNNSAINANHDVAQDGPDPGTAHAYLVAQETETQDTVSTGDHAAVPSSPSPSNTGTRSYGVNGLNAAALGVAPPPHVAQRLISIFFQHWHPFFPFLHGPSFVEQVNQFYNEDPAPTATNISRVSRAVMFQCVFNIAASSSASILDSSSRIQSNSDLLSLVGALISNHDMATLQSLLAAELYLTCRMSLRDASTIHGAVSRAIFNAGYHRCPSRYRQLRTGTCDIRKRIFWCTYVLDRFLSQALGHPFSIQDSDVDVCIPGMAELHKPASSATQDAPSQSALNAQILDHLPGNAQDTAHSHVPASVGPSRSGQPGDFMTTYGALSGRSPAKNYNAIGKDANVLTLSYLVTYSRLLGDIVHLLHRSIHSRSITPDSIEDVTFQIHCWWNSLPAAFQDDTRIQTPSVQSAVFKMLHNYLILLINRPFLSLPPNQRQFQSSLQTAIAASRTIIVTLKHHLENSFLVCWPPTMSASWMAGLVIAFATLLDLYPFTKAESDLQSCLTILETMKARWISARHCHDALSTFLKRLATIFSSGSHKMSLNSSMPFSSQHRGTENAFNLPSPSFLNNGRRLISDTWTSHQGPTHDNQDVGAGSFEYRDWAPVVTYTGPDFGFDAAHLLGQDFLNGGDQIDLGTIFGNIG